MLGVTVSSNFKYFFIWKKSRDNHCIPSSDCWMSSLVGVPTVCCSLKYFMNQRSKNKILVSQRQLKFYKSTKNTSEIYLLSKITCLKRTKILMLRLSKLLISMSMLLGPQDALMLLDFLSLYIFIILSFVYRIHPPYILFIHQIFYSSM